MTASAARWSNSDTATIELEFLAALRKAGLGPYADDLILAHGCLHRYRLHDDKPGRKSGWALLYTDGVPRGVAGDWRTNERITWTPDGAQITEVNRSGFLEKRRERERERDRAADIAEHKALTLFQRLPPAPSTHPYLERKQVPPGPCRIADASRLVIPVLDAVGGTIISLQFISADGYKRFLTCGRVAGGCCILGSLDGTDPLAIAEGYATGASIRGATGWPVVVAFTCGNLGAVAQAMRTKFPHRILVLAADNDTESAGNPGLTKAREAALAVNARLAVPPEAGDFNDLSVAKGGGAVREVLDRAIDTEPIEPESERDSKSGTDDEVIARLAKMKAFDYDRARETEAKRLGIRVSTLDKMVASERGDNTGEDEGAPKLFPEIDPWPDPVDGADLLDALAAVFVRHVVLPTGAADAAALWVLHAHAHDTSSISPILAITSPTPECGKTSLLTLLGALVPRPLSASNITAAAVFRAVEKWRPTLLVDEADTFLRESDELRGVINSGHNRGAAYVIRTVGDHHEPKQFATWAPKAIALIGKLPPTLASRAIHMEMRRMAPGERVEPVRADRLDHLQPLNRQAARWVIDHRRALLDAEPTMSAMLSGRRADNWRHLLALADAAGGDWPQRARRAAETLNASDAGQTAAIVLLGDVRAIFAEQRVDKVASEDLAAMLGKMESRPWPEWSRGKPITPRQIAKLLEPFKIGPLDVRLADGRTGIKGYRLDTFADAFSRYLSDVSATPLHPKESATFSDDGNATNSGGVADRDGRQVAENLECSGVADGDPKTWDADL